MSLIHLIQNKPSVINNVHESCFRCYDILEHVKKMLKRGDSKESIEDFIRWSEEEKR